MTRPPFCDAGLRAQHQMEVVLHFRSEFYFNCEQAGQLFFSPDDSVATMREVLTC